VRKSTPNVNQTRRSQPYVIVKTPTVIKVGLFRWFESELGGRKGDELKAAADVHPRVGHQPKTGALEATWRSPT
jgi:hypothetical protein